MIKIINGNYLIPHSYRKYGWLLLIISVCAGIILTILDFNLDWPNVTVFAIYSDEIFESSHWFGFIKNSISDELVSIGLIAGGIIVAFSKEKIEDEYISHMRLRSLVWATYINYAVLLVAVLFIYGMPFFSIMVYNMFTLLFFFILKYQWSIHQWKKSLSDEE